MSIRKTPFLHRGTGLTTICEYSGNITIPCLQPPFNNKQCLNFSLTIAVIHGYIFSDFALSSDMLLFDCHFQKE
jgi:hypothetical protein